MNITDFDTVLEDARRMYQTIQTGLDCPSDDILFDYVYEEASDEEYKEVSNHIQTCELCRIQAFKMESDKIEWEYMLDTNPDAVLSDAVGSTNVCHAASGSASLKTIFLSGVSKLKHAAVRYISELFEPTWAGQMQTASGSDTDEHLFEMKYGEYINITCYWQGKEKHLKPYIELAWNANILTPGRLWARFVNPATQSILFEICLGTELEGKLILDEHTLGFNPSREKWAISVIIEEIR